ncbi:hypothetical protein PILCRDRAFT_3346 [Piloderma croceum F 1598]|uniref:Uncharacterized protein n=1 Tax=Piloderma croceum (strain F 1598) TaxID=765440 RepID=A0A0C3BPB6_PILCF|nr:hypothetical protein PILCRDRAFT_3346 [Piloderma croceum F 1598]
MTEGPPSRPSHQHTHLQTKLYLQPTDDDPTHDETLFELGLDIGNAWSPAAKAAIIVAAHIRSRWAAEAMAVNRKTHRPHFTEKDLPLLPSDPIEAVDAPAIAYPTMLISMPTLGAVLVSYPVDAAN